MKPSIKTIHFVAPKVYVWRENRVKKLKYFIDHILLLFPFEKKYFKKENIDSTFTGHPLLENYTNDNNDFTGLLNEKKKFISIYPGSRLSEIYTLIPILFKFIKLMDEKYHDILFVFHSTKEHSNLIKKLVSYENFQNCEVINDEKIKSSVLKKSIFAVSKSGTISLEICNAKIPSIIIYKMNVINFFIIKLLVRVKFANIVNIAANEEIIPELLQSNCNPNNIFNTVSNLIQDQDALEKQVYKTQEIIKTFKTDRSTEIACSVLINYL